MKLRDNAPSSQSAQLRTKAIQPRSGSSPGPWLHNNQSNANHSSTSIVTGVCGPILRHCIRADRINHQLLRLPHRFEGGILGSLTGDKVTPGVGANSRSPLLTTGGQRET